MSSSKIIRFFLYTLVVVVGSPANSQGNNNVVVKREINYKAYTSGQRLYLKNCAVCHGRSGEGAKGWRKPDKNGANLAPPLNGTGHAWHHSSQSLANTIKNGTAKLGGNMPAWKDRLSNSEIKLILLWIKAQWPDEIYTAWYNRFHQK